MTRASKKHTVDRTRLTWVLAALVLSMTIGTVVLGVLEPHKMLKNAKTTYLAATYNTDSSTKISRTAIPVEENDLWQAVVIHTTRNASLDDLSVRCASNGRTLPAIAHFAVSPDASIRIGSRWASQEPASDRYQGKIVIAIQLADGRTDATLDQAKALVALIRDLQARCNISASKVYVHSQLGGKACSNPLVRYNWRQSLLP